MVKIKLSNSISLFQLFRTYIRILKVQIPAPLGNHPQICLVKVQLQHSIYFNQLQFNFVRVIYFLSSILNQYHVGIQTVFDLIHHFYMDSFNKETFILSSKRATKCIFARSIGIHNKNTVLLTRQTLSSVLLADI